MPESEEKAVKLLYFMWKNIDHEGMSASRRMGIWDEFLNKVIFSSRSPTPERMLETFARKFGIGAYRNPEMLDKLTEETVQVIRKSPRKIVLLLRNVIEVEKKRYQDRAGKQAVNKLAEKMQANLDASWNEFVNEREGQA